MEKKIKIDVITLHAVQNYGSVLQALATQEILKQHSLYTVDLICHGSPSPKVLDMFLAQYDIDTPKLSDIQFRNTYVWKL